MIARQTILGRDTERVIAAARVLLASAGLIAHLFDPQKHLSGAYLLLISSYGLLGAVVLLTQSGLGRPKLAKAMHLTDVAFASVMIFSPTSAAFSVMLATFCLLSCVVQWRWPAVIATGAFFAAIYFCAVILHLIGRELVVVRGTYLVLVPLGLAIAARNAETSRSRLLKLARWSSGRYSAPGDAVARVFQHAADVLDAGEVVVFYTQIDNPTAYKATFKAGSTEFVISPCQTWPNETVAAEFDNQALLVVDPTLDLCLTYGGMRRATMNPTPGLELSSRSGIVASAPFSGEFCNGRLFACGIKNWRWDQLVLVEIVASHVRSRLEGRLLRERATRMTAELERMRLARDLHDGILQSLTAARLQLNSLTRDEPLDRADRLNIVADLLQEEQQRLREFIEVSRSAQSELVPISRVAERIATVAEHWRLRADISVECPRGDIPFTLYREIYFMVGEAIANSARHGAANAISASLQCIGDRLVLELKEQDGKAGAQNARGMIPRSINERLRDLGGALALTQGPNGVSLRLEIPLNA